jgi:hypothetical protein
MKIEIEIPTSRLVQLMSSAIEGGDPVTVAAKGGWCAGIYLRGSWEKRMKELNEFWYSDPKLYASNEFTIEIVELVDESKPASGRNLKKHRVNQESFVSGLAIMAKKFPHQFSQVMRDDIDGPGADAFLQSMLFGDEKYA